MGEHKNNPNVQLAKEGKLKPKEPKQSKRATEREMFRMAQNLMYARLGILPGYFYYS